MSKITGSFTRILDAAFRVVPKEILITYLVSYLTDFAINSIKNPNSREAQLIIPELQALKDSLNRATYLK